MSDFTMDPHPVPRRQGRQEDQLSRRDVVKAALGVVGLGSLGIGAFVGRVALWPHRLVYQLREFPRWINWPPAASNPVRLPVSYLHMPIGIMLAVCMTSEASR